MSGRAFCLAMLIGVTMQMAQVHSTAVVLSSICNKVEECYVDESTSEACNRTEKKCNPCLIKKKSNSFSSLDQVWNEYICYDVDEEGNCPSGTTKCPATLKTSNDEDDKSSSESDDLDENSNIPSTSSSTKKNLLLSNSSLLNSTKNISLFSNTNLSNSSTQISSTPKRATSSYSFSDSSGSSEPSIMKKLTTKMTTKSSTLPSSGDKSVEDTSSSLHESSFAIASERFNSTSRKKPTGISESAEKDENPNQSSAVAPKRITPTATESTTPDSVLNDESYTSNTARGGSESDGNQMGLIIGIIGSAAVLVAFAGFVFWRKMKNDKDSDDEDATFSSNKPVTNRNVVSLPSASSSTTAYLARPNHYENNNKKYKYQHSGNGYHNNHTATRYATVASAGAAAGMVPASYDSSQSIDIDGEDELRRTDSILGGTSGDPSPTNSDTNQDIWGNDVGSFRQKYTASSASVEF